MKVPLDWIRELVPDERASAEKLAEALTFSGTEVEAIEVIGKNSVLHCAVTSNRVDCLGMTGMAREIAAIRRKTFSPPDASVAFTAPKTSGRVRVEVRAPEFCPRYCAFVIDGLRVGASPDWLVARLAALGVRPVNNVVDVTNLVLFEQNQPLHAFDADKIAGGTIVVRRAEAGETIVALNERTYRLEAWMGVIADREKPIAIAGVMGGLFPSVSAGTTSIVIESAYFDPPSIRRASRALGLFSDSSHRFERGIDATGAHHAACRAAKLILELAGGTLREDPIDVDVNRADPGPPSIGLRAKRIREVTGASVPAKRVEEILVALGCKMSPAADGAWAVTPPTFRADLSREIDLVEEIIRVVGLDRVPEGVGLLVRPVAQNPRRRLVRAVADHLASVGFLECVTPTFIAAGLHAGIAFLDGGESLVARNPVRSGEGVIRRSLLPSLLIVREHNQDQGNEDLSLFETASLAFDAAADIPKQIDAAGLLLDGEFRDMKGVVESLGEALGTPLTFETCAHGGLAPGLQLSARIGDAVAGVIGVVHPALVAHHRLKAAPVYAEIDLSTILTAWRPIRSFRGLPRFPAVRRDLAFVVDAARPFSGLEAAIRGASIDEIESVEFFDEYRGAQVGAGRKSVALTVVFRAADRTLSSAEVDGFVARIVASAQTALQATLRA